MKGREEESCVRGKVHSRGEVRSLIELGVVIRWYQAVYWKHTLPQMMVRSYKNSH